MWPAAELRRRGWNTKFSLADAPEADVVLVHRPLSMSLLRLVERLQARGSKVLVSEDDDLNTVALTGNVGLAARITRKRLRNHDEAIRAADGLVVTTPRLAKVYGPLAKRTFVVPNYLPARMSRQSRFKVRDGHVRVGWAGIVQTHRADLEWFAPVARQAMRGAMFSTIGDFETKAVLRIPRCEAFGWAEDISVLYRTMARADVGIVPLAPHRFNEAKSWLKALEYMTVGVPVVATDLSEQRALITHGVDGFLASTPEEFAGYVQTLIHDTALRCSMSTMAAAKAATLTIEQYGYLWEDALRQTLEAPCR